MTSGDAARSRGLDEFAAPLAATAEAAFLSGVELGRADGLEPAVELALGEDL